MTFTNLSPKAARRAGIGLALILAAGVLLFTRFGVFLVFDVAGDLRGSDNFKTTYADAPIQITHVLSDVENVSLPANIEQVSGVIQHDGKFVLSTDQAELFVLDQAGDQAAEGGNLFPFTPLLLRQGSIESVTKVEGEFWLAGETGTFVRTNLSGDIVGSHPLPKQLTTSDITGLTFDNEKTVFVTIDDSMLISKVNVETGELNSLQLRFQTLSDQPMVEGTFLWSGLAYEAGRLFMMAENYPLIVVADAVTGKVLAALGIEGPHEFSDISVSEGQVTLSSDHNFFDERPPLRVYQLPEEGIFEVTTSD